MEEYIARVDRLLRRLIRRHGARAAARGAGERLAATARAGLGGLCFEKGYFGVHLIPSQATTDGNGVKNAWLVHWPACPVGKPDALPPSAHGVPDADTTMQTCSALNMEP